MAIFLISFLVIALAALLMALGAIAGRRPITAGCGGCETCDGACERPPS